MIGLVPYNLEASVNLLKEHHPHHLVRKSHFRERQLEVCHFADFMREPKASADDKGHIASAFKTEIFNL